MVILCRCWLQHRIQSSTTNFSVSARIEFHFVSVHKNALPSPEKICINIVLLGSVCLLAETVWRYESDRKTACESGIKTA
jgi:hypothetical protein